MIRVKWKLNSFDVIDVLTGSVHLRAAGFIRSDNDPEFVAEGGARLDISRRRKAASNQDHHGRTFLHGFNARLAMNCSMVRSSTAREGADRDRRRRNSPLQHGCRPHSERPGHGPPAPETIVPDGPETGNALTMKADHFVGAGHAC